MSVGITDWNACSHHFFGSTAYSLWIYQRYTDKMAKKSLTGRQYPTIYSIPKISVQFADGPTKLGLLIELDLHCIESFITA
ncbi:hypothetical protein DICVIV_02818 [Dictyocaulus viviparus]|uniref:Uncharacterized protein n=1 Tax=Dictyocaulus viviparus TaxID=29172 RepID=A0A0D8Y4D4_DICVI|nr:hypothetical protein DICVIV_02818 [Dictyocaulus viviparus]